MPSSPRLSTEQLRRADALLERILDADVAQREPLVEALTNEPPVVRDAVLELLRLAETPESIAVQRFDFDRPIVESVARFSDQAGDGSGARIGPYRIVGQLGEGGMGTVHLAERADGAFERRVAIKVSRLLTPGGEEQFERERQILATLSHPHIAHLLDGGMTATGLPYLVMEYVEGLDILAYCDRHRLDVEQRIDLFLQVADAVSHAHLHLIVHRDLKPSNILVDGEGRIKLLDFGIAKLLSPIDSTPLPEPPEAATVTRLGVMTPEYASPEQARGEPITTASDVYQLGAILYELLTGARPVRIVGRTPAEIERAICSTTPVTPSRVTAGAVDGESARARAATRRLLSHRLAGDLDAIILTAIRKTPSRRYPTVAAFAEDLRRFRRGLPVAARADTLRYRAGKAIRRNPLPFAASLLLVALVVAYVGTVTLQSRRLAEQRDLARSEARKAEEVTDFVLGLFEISAPDEALAADLGETITARELLERAESQVHDGLRDAPETRGAMLDVLGQVYTSLALYPEAARLLTEAEEVRAGLGPRHARDRGATLGHLATLSLRQAEYARALDLATQAIAELERAGGEDVGEIAGALATASDAEERLGRFEDAQRSAERGLELQRRAGARNATTALLESRLGRIAYQRADFDEAYRRFEEASHLAAAGGDRLLHAELLGAATTSLVASGHLSPAVDSYRRLIEELESARGREHPSIGTWERGLGTALFRLGRSSEAEDVFRAAIRRMESGYGSDHPEVAKSRFELAELLRHERRFDEAEAEYERTVAILTPRLPAGHPYLARSAAGLASLYLDRGEIARAEPLLREGYEILSNRLPGSDQTARVAIDLGRCLLVSGRGDEADPLVQAGLETLAELYLEGDPRVAQAALRVAVSLAAAGREREAHDLLDRFYPDLVRGFGPEHADTLQASALMRRLDTG